MMLATAVSDVTFLVAVVLLAIGVVTNSISIVLMNRRIDEWRNR